MCKRLYPTESVKYVGVKDVRANDLSIKLIRVSAIILC